MVGITTAQLHSTKPEIRFCSGSKPHRGVLEIRDGEDLWQWSQLKIRLNIFCRSTIPQKQFIIINSPKQCTMKFSSVPYRSSNTTISEISLERKLIKEACSIYFKENCKFDALTSKHRPSCTSMDQLTNRLLSA